MERIRQVIFFKRYFLDFFDQQTEKCKQKIDHVLFVVSASERIPMKFFQHLEGTKGLYEIRVEFNSNIYRIFCCFDEGQVLVLFNGFEKKSQKIPVVELDKALKIMNEYFVDKQKKKQKKKQNESKNLQQ